MVFYDMVSYVPMLKYHARPIYANIRLKRYSGLQSIGSLERKGGRFTLLSVVADSMILELRGPLTQASKALHFLGKRVGFASNSSEGFFG